eukprot:763869-Hanusia_phi.AAC.1
MGNSSSRRNYVIAEIQSDIKLLMDTCPEHKHLDWNDVDCISHHSAINALQNYALFEKLRTSNPKLWFKKDRRMNKMNKGCSRRPASVRFADAISHIPRKQQISDSFIELDGKHETSLQPFCSECENQTRSSDEVSISNSLDSTAATVIALEDFFSENLRNTNSLSGGEQRNLKLDHVLSNSGINVCVYFNSISKFRAGSKVSVVGLLRHPNLRLTVDSVTNSASGVHLTFRRQLCQGLVLRGPPVSESD